MMATTPSALLMASSCARLSKATIIRHNGASSAAVIAIRKKDRRGELTAINVSVHKRSTTAQQ